ncbi:plasmid stabilization protein [Mesorhizobium sp. CAU 1741]|uniref:FitA-like ribbon-helix-helix domain-containing protein n=1 Tax=Mesorhizobium sp. CAU 1741 TaxID=3140366 RepID=UPI00325AA2F1
MAALTIRNIDDETKQALRLRAARHGVSMEQEVRTILKNAVLSSHPKERSDERPGRNFYESIRELVEPYGGFDLDIPERSKDMRDPPVFE